MPDAFLYTYAGEQPGPNGSPLVHLTFKPNPKFSPPNHETMVYQGMEGDMLIDPKAARIAKIDGTLFKDVDFGWGILGRLYKGGKFLIEQRDVGSGHWETTREILQFNGKILMVKSLTISSTETTYDFRPVPANITTAQALELLYKSDEVVAENGGGVKEATISKVAKLTPERFRGRYIRVERTFRSASGCASKLGFQPTAMQRAESRK